MGSSTIKLHAVVGWIVSEVVLDVLCDLTPRIQPENSARNGRRGVNTCMSAVSSDSLFYRLSYTSPYQ